LQQIAREQRDQAVEKLRQKYAARFAQLEERKRRAEQAVEREAEEAKDQKFQTAISFGATVLSSFLGRKRTSMSTLGRATTAVRGVSRTRRQADDVDRAEENVAAVTQRLADLEAEFKAEVETIERSFDPQTEQLGTVSLKPTKANINVKLLTLVWVPYRQDAGAQAKPAWE
jgi:molybdopterin converting factor small subunit